MKAKNVSQALVRKPEAQARIVVHSPAPMRFEKGEELSVPEPVEEILALQIHESLQLGRRSKPGGEYVSAAWKQVQWENCGRLANAIKRLLMLELGLAETEVKVEEVYFLTKEAELAHRSSVIQDLHYAEVTVGKEEATPYLIFRVSKKSAETLDRTQFQEKLDRLARLCMGTERLSADLATGPQYTLDLEGTSTADASNEVQGAATEGQEEQVVGVDVADCVSAATTAKKIDVVDGIAHGFLLQAGATTLPSKITISGHTLDRPVVLVGKLAPRPVLKSVDQHGVQWLCRVDGFKKRDRTVFLHQMHAEKQLVATKREAVFDEARWLDAVIEAACDHTDQRYLAVVDLHEVDGKVKVTLTDLRKAALDT